MPWASCKSGRSAGVRGSCGGSAQFGRQTSAAGWRGRSAPGCACPGWPTPTCARPCRIWTRSSAVWSCARCGTTSAVRWRNCRNWPPSPAAGRRGAQRGGALAAEGERDLRHPGGGGGGARAVREHVREGDVGLLDQPPRVLRHGVGLGREPGDQVGPDGDPRPQRAGASGHREHVGARVAAAHPLQHQVATRLHRQVEVGHQPGFLRHQPPEVGVDRGRVERRQSEARQFRHQRQQPPRHLAERRPPGAGRLRSWPGRRRSARPRGTRPRPPPAPAPPRPRPAPTGSAPGPAG